MSDTMSAILLVLLFAQSGFLLSGGAFLAVLYWRHPILKHVVAMALSYLGLLAILLNGLYVGRLTYGTWQFWLAGAVTTFGDYGLWAVLKRGLGERHLK